MKRHLLSFSMLFCISCVWSLSLGATDSLQLAQLLREIDRYCTIQPDSALRLADSCLILSQELDNTVLISKTHYLKGVAYKNKSEFEQAETSYRLATETALTIPDSLLAAEGWYGLGILRRHQGEYVSSLSLLNKALLIRKHLDAAPTTLARTYHSIGNILYSIGDIAGAIDRYQQSLVIHQSIPANARFVASTQSNLGAMYITLENPDSALIYLKPAYDYYQANNHQLGAGATAINLSETYLLLKQGKLAQQYAEQGLAHLQEVKDISRQGMAYNALAKIAEYQNDMDAAINYVEKSLAIAEKVGRPDNIREERVYLAELYAKDGRWEEAYHYYQAYAELKDSLFNESINAQIEQSEQELEDYVKDQEIASLKAEKDRQQIQRNWLTAVLLLTLGFLGFAFWGNRRRQRALRNLQKEQKNTQRLLTEKERLFKELENTQLKLIESEKMVSLGQLTAGIAHEINNPINFVAGNLGALQMDIEDLMPLLELLQQLNKVDETNPIVKQLKEQTEAVDLPFLVQEIRQLLTSIDNGAKRTHQIVHSLGTFSRNTTENFLPADINEGIQSTLMLMQGSMPGEISLKTDLKPLPAIICQITRLNQVFLNLLNNAVQAIAGEGEIRIETKHIQDNQVEIIISDTGKGMDEDTQQRIFEPFFTTKKVGEGTGLGLSISYGIVKQHEGEITVKSELGQGTTFRILLPIDHPTSNNYKEWNPKLPYFTSTTNRTTS